MTLPTRRSLLCAIAALSGLAVARHGVAQVGSGGTGISPAASIGNAQLVAGVVTLRREGQAAVPLENGGAVMQGDQIDTAD